MTGLLLCGVSSVAHGHSWYPQECCHDQDCEEAEETSPPSDDYSRTLKGKKTGTVVNVPRNFPSRPSQDGKTHMCVMGGSGYFMPKGEPLLLCVFLPPEV